METNNPAIANESLKQNISPNPPTISAENTHGSIQENTETKRKFSVIEKYRKIEPEGRINHYQFVTRALLFNLLTNLFAILLENSKFIDKIPSRMNAEIKIPLLGILMILAIAFSTKIHYTLLIKRFRESNPPSTFIIAKFFLIINAFIILLVIAKY